MPNQGVQAVAELKCLTWLNLSLCSLMDVGVRAVAGLTNLTHLSLAATSVTDATPLL